MASKAMEPTTINDMLILILLVISQAGGAGPGTGVSNPFC